MARILVLDPDVALRHFLREVLEEASYSVLEAHNSYEYEGLRQRQAPRVPGDKADLLYLVAFDGAEPPAGVG